MPATLGASAITLSVQPTLSPALEAAYPDIWPGLATVDVAAVTLGFKTYHVYNRLRALLYLIFDRDPLEVFPLCVTYYTWS